MLPPVDPEVLRNNPDFAKLYATITKDILNADGTVKKRSPEEAQDEERIKVPLPCSPLNFIIKLHSNTTLGVQRASLPRNQSRHHRQRHLLRHTTLRRLS